MRAGHIYVIGGDGLLAAAAGRAGDGGPAIDTQLASPTGVAADHHGNVLVVDSQDNKIRVIAENTGRFYGQRMTAGDIYTIAGTGVAGSTGNGGPATSAEIAFPFDLAADAHGNIALAVACQVRVIAAHTGQYYGQHMSAGDIYLIAGGATCGFSGDGGPATQAQLCGANAPDGIAVTPSSALVIGDCIRIREITN